MGLVLLFVGLNQSWALVLGIINLSLISAIMALGVNIQWGYAGLFNVDSHDLENHHRFVWTSSGHPVEPILFLSYN